MKWSLSNSCKDKFSVGQKVQTRGDMGRFNLKIAQIHNDHYCECKSWPFGRLRHFNMNCLEPINETNQPLQPTRKSRAAELYR
jgi:hypothetical protein